MATICSIIATVSGIVVTVCGLIGYIIVAIDEATNCGDDDATAVATLMPQMMPQTVAPLMP